MVRANRKGVDICFSCEDSRGRAIVIETVRETEYVRRIRRCSRCGTTWSTGEINLKWLRRLLKLNRGITELIEDFQ